MFPKNPFLQLTLPRATSALPRIQELIWKEQSVLPLSFSSDSNHSISWHAATELKFRTVELPFPWGKLFEQSWFKIELPVVPPGTPLYLHWQEQGESTLYLDGMPYYGFDVAHKYCPLPPGKARTAYLESLCLQSAIWHPEARGLNERGSLVTKVGLFTRNDLAWEVYHDFVVLYELALEEGKTGNFEQRPHTASVGYQPAPEIVTVLYRRLLRTLDDAVNAFDGGGLAAMKKVLKQAYTQLEGQHDRITSVLTGHAHIDLVWLWPERSAEYKAVHTFSTMNRLMDHYPEFKFGYSQPASYDAVARKNRKLRKQVSFRIEEGSWEAVGATEVESDTLMACGEALARSFTLGQKGFQRIQGKPSKVLWIPDVFGYSGCLPQLMKQTGVEYFFTTKLTWSSINRFPHSSFIWKGIDGSEVIVHVTQENGYNQCVTPKEIRTGARAYRQADVHDEYLAPTGYGDGGGGVTEEMCERARRLASIAGMPEVKWGRIDNFFERLDTKRNELPEWQGELYLEYHRGALTTHGDPKDAFRASERGLQAWEAARCALGRGEIDEQVWRRVVFAQFHDYIPGSSIWEVYEESIPELRGIAKQALASASKDLSSGKSPALFNPLPQAVTVLVDNRTRAVRLPPLSGGPVEELATVVSEQAVFVSTRKLSNARTSAKFDAKGRIIDLKFDGIPIPIASKLGELVIYPDQAHCFPAWDIDRQVLSMGQIVDSVADAAVTRNSETEGCVQFTRSVGQASVVRVRYWMDAFHPALHIEYEIDWHETDTLLKAHFDTEYSGQSARFGSPFGSVLRSQMPGQLRDEAMFEAAGSRWAIVSDDGETAGLSVITEAKYGFSCREGNLGVSLLRSPLITGEDESHRNLFNKNLRVGDERKRHTDQGRHVIRLALCPHNPELSREALAPSLADTLFTPPLQYSGTAKSSGFLRLEGGASLVPTWAKPAADGKGWILRLNETLGRRGKSKLKLAEGYSATPTDLLEECISDKPVKTVAFRPYALISLRITDS